MLAEWGALGDARPSPAQAGRGEKSARRDRDARKNMQSPKSMARYEAVVPPILTLCTDTEVPNGGPIPVSCTLLTVGPVALPVPL
ncbi:hypothetical protein EVAR_76284_1 [Eumeta japonica]|uniref:Uncharacterized protein n=1 Tax=Eumeta variegata TaxID=151549 RepID=A0A4C1UPC8_EUMVA|nr:hypothetical protein EVAR_76284_1 [Eumeta japonica]